MGRHDDRTPTGEPPHTGVPTSPTGHGGILLTADVTSSAPSSMERSVGGSLTSQYDHASWAKHVMAHRGRARWTTLCDLYPPQNGQSCYVAPGWDAAGSAATSRTVSGGPHHARIVSPNQVTAPRGGVPRSLPGALAEYYTSHDRYRSTGVNRPRYTGSWSLRWVARPSLGSTPCVT